MQTLSIVGAGKVGQVLGRVLLRARVLQPAQVLNRSLASAQQAAAFIGGGQAIAAMSRLRKADVYMLSVPDDSIAASCAALAQAGVLDEDSIVFHCSGAKASTELHAAAACGASVASLHPVRSFADPLAVADDFAGTICSVEGDARALDLLLPALQAAGAQTVQISAAGKLLYHAGAVFANNYLVTLLDTALRAYQAAGVSREMAQAMAEPLARQTLENVFALGTAQALTGPIARGDMATVASQQRAVAGWDGTAGDLYAAFIAPTVALAKCK